jgi:hypothetical protein
MRLPIFRNPADAAAGVFDIDVVAVHVLYATKTYRIVHHCLAQVFGVGWFRERILLDLLALLSLF